MLSRSGPLLAALAVLILAGCGSSSSSSSSAASGSSSSTGGTGSFCAAYAQYQHLEQTSDPKNPDETKQVIDQTLAALAAVEAAAPPEIQADAATTVADVQAGFAVIQKHGYDIDIALNTGTPDELKALTLLGSAPEDGTAAARVVAYVRTACPDITIPTEQSKFSSVGSAVN